MSLSVMAGVPPFVKGGQGGFLRPTLDQAPPNPPQSPFRKGGSRDVGRLHVMSMHQ